MTSVEVAELMHRAVIMLAALTVTLNAAPVNAVVLIRTIAAVLAMIFVGVLAQAVHADLPRWTFDDLAVAAAARRVGDALVPEASEPLSAVIILLALHVRNEPFEGEGVGAGLDGWVADRNRHRHRLVDLNSRALTRIGFDDAECIGLHRADGKAASLRLDDADLEFGGIAKPLTAD